VWLAACVPATSAATVASDHTESHQFWLICAVGTANKAQHRVSAQRRMESSVEDNRDWQRVQIESLFVFRKMGPPKER